MYGAIIGDFIGSIYEYNEYKDSKNKIVNTSRRNSSAKEENIFKDNCFYSDDSILTIAVLDAILKGKSYEDSIKEYALENKDLYVNKKEEGFEGPFSKRFLRWCVGNEKNDSFGNGASMRISPIAYMFNDLEKIMIEVEKCTKSSHDSEEAIIGAKAVASAIYLSRTKHSKEEIKKYIETNFDYNLNFDLENLHKEYMFSSITRSSVPQAIYLFMISNSFEDLLRKCLYIGGDTDTIACIAGSIGEAYFGIDKKLIDLVKEKLPTKYVKLLNEGYKKIKNITR